MAPPIPARNGVKANEDILALAGYSEDAVFLVTLGFAFIGSLGIIFLCILTKLCCEEFGATSRSYPSSVSSVSRTAERPWDDSTFTDRTTVLDMPLEEGVTWEGHQPVTPPPKYDDVALTGLLADDGHLPPSYESVLHSNEKCPTCELGHV